MSLNPYETPQTPSDQLASSADVKTRPCTAYRRGDVFFCESDFEPPKVCFKTGAPIGENEVLSTLYCKSICIHFYFHPDYIRSLGRIKSLHLLVTLFLALGAVALAIILSMALIVIPVVLLFIYTNGVTKEKSIRIDPQSNGYFAFHGAHPSFLRLFPDR